MFALDIALALIVHPPTLPPVFAPPAKVFVLAAVLAWAKVAFVPAKVEALDAALEASLVEVFIAVVLGKDSICPIVTVAADMSPLKKALPAVSI